MKVVKAKKASLPSLGVLSLLSFWLEWSNGGSSFECTSFLDFFQALWVEVELRLNELWIEHTCSEFLLMWYLAFENNWNLEKDFHICALEHWNLSSETLIITEKVCMLWVQLPLWSMFLPLQCRAIRSIWEYTKLSIWEYTKLSIYDSGHVRPEWLMSQCFLLALHSWETILKPAQGWYDTDHGTDQPHTVTSVLVLYVHNSAGCSG